MNILKSGVVREETLKMPHDAKTKSESDAWYHAIQSSSEQEDRDRRDVVSGSVKRDNCGV